MPKYTEEGTAPTRSWLAVIVEMAVAVLTFFAIFMNRRIEAFVLQTMTGDAIAYALLALLYAFCGTALVRAHFINNATSETSQPTTVVFALASYALSAWYLVQVALAH